MSELEKRAVREAIESALAEIEQSEDFSQGVVDGLNDALRILGGTTNVE